MKTRLKLSRKHVLLELDAPHFNAGLLIVDGYVKEAAPILGYMTGWSIKKATSYAEERGWRLRVIRAKA